MKAWTWTMVLASPRGQGVASSRSVARPSAPSEQRAERRPDGTALFALFCVRFLRLHVLQLLPTAVVPGLHGRRIKSISLTP